MTVESQEVSSQLLKNKYNLHASPEVKAAARRTRARSGERIPQDPSSQINNYLNRFQEILDRPDQHRREQGIKALKYMLLGKFITKFDDIPESYWQSQERILRERGQQGDYNRFSEEQKISLKEELSEGILSDQRASLEQWIDYFASADSAYMPNYIKYWVFRSITGLAEYDKEKQEFPKRSKGTLKMFPDINHEALSYVVDAVIKKQKGEAFNFGQFGADLTKEDKQKFRQSLANENFADLYAWANEQIAPIPQHLLPVTSGRWIKYDQGSDPATLISSIRGRGTGWCTAGENTASYQLQSGDFYIFYSNDEKNNPIYPRIAIRMEQGGIAEVRGIAYKQNLDPYMPGVLAEKLKEFPDAAQYLKKEADMKVLTEVEAKTVAGLPLNAQELKFLYEIDPQIEGFGYMRDPRIKEIRSQRSPEVDMLIVFNCEPEQIARTANDINENTRAFVGPLTQGIFDAIERHKIEYAYTSFPEGKICFDEVTIGGIPNKEPDYKLEKALEEQNIDIRRPARDIMRSFDFTTLPEHLELSIVKLKVEDLGFRDGATTEELYKRAEELGLALCPAELGPHLRLKDLRQPSGDLYFIAMKQIADSRGRADVFALGQLFNDLWLSTPPWVRPVQKWPPESGFVFCLGKR
jgi:hypothetical protein